MAVERSLASLTVVFDCLDGEPKLPNLVDVEPRPGLCPLTWVDDVRILVVERDFPLFAAELELTCLCPTAVFDRLVQREVRLESPIEVVVRIELVWGGLDEVHADLPRLPDEQRQSSDSLRKTVR